MTGILMLFLFLVAVPILTGTLIVPHIHRENAETLTFSYFSGLMLLISIMQLLAVPMTLTRKPFSLLADTYTVFLAVLCLAAFIFRRKQIKKIFSRAWQIIKGADRKWFLAVLLIYIPAAGLAFFTPYAYGDDKTYLTMVNDILSSDKLYQIDMNTGEEITWILSKYSLSSYWTWLAYLAKISGIHPLILCKTILSFVFVPMGYAVQGLISSFLFRNNERRMLLYLFFVNLVTIFGGFSNYTVTYRFYTWVWQSKAFLAMIILPFIFYYCNLIFEKKAGMGEFFFLLFLVIASSSATLTGTGLAVGMVMVLAVVYGFLNRSIMTVAGALLSCCPAFFYMLMHMKYTELLNWLNF